MEFYLAHHSSQVRLRYGVFSAWQGSTLNFLDHLSDWTSGCEDPPAFHPSLLVWAFVNISVPLNSSDARDGIFRLIWSIPCILMPGWLKSPGHQQAWYWEYRIQGCSSVNFVFFCWIKSKTWYEMWMHLLWSLKQCSMLRVNLHPSHCSDFTGAMVHQSLRKHISKFQFSWANGKSEQCQAPCDIKVWGIGCGLRYQSEWEIRCHLCQRSWLRSPISKIRMILLMDAKAWMPSLIIMFAVRPICVQDSIFKMSSESPVCDIKMSETWVSFEISKWVRHRLSFVQG